MKTKNMLCLALALIIATPQSLLAQSRQIAQSTQVPQYTSVDLKSGKYKVTSIIYSSTTGQALVGVLDKSTRTLATFLECEAPQGPLQSSITEKDLSNCFARRGLWFEANDKNLDQLDKVFPIRMQANFANEFLNDVERASNPNLFIGLLMSSAGTAMTIASAAHLKESLRNRAMVSAAKGGIAAVMGAAVTIAGLLIYGSAEFGGRSVPALEASTLQAYTKLLKENPETPVLEFKPRYFVLTFKVLTQSIFETITTLNQI